MTRFLVILLPPALWRPRGSPGHDPCGRGCAGRSRLSSGVRPGLIVLPGSASTRFAPWSVAISITAIDSRSSPWRMLRIFRVPAGGRAGRRPGELRAVQGAGGRVCRGAEPGPRRRHRATARHQRRAAQEPADGRSCRRDPIFGSTCTGSRMRLPGGPAARRGPPPAACCSSRVDGSIGPTATATISRR